MNTLPRVFSSIPRLKIIACLVDACENVSCLTLRCGLSQSAVSQHLKRLRDLGIVSFRSSGRNRVYTLERRDVGHIAKKILAAMDRKS